MLNRLPPDFIITLVVCFFLWCDKLFQDNNYISYPRCGICHFPQGFLCSFKESDIRDHYEDPGILFILFLYAQSCLRNPMDHTVGSLWPHRLYSPWNSPGQNTEVDNCFLLQGIFPTQVSHIAGRSFTSWATEGSPRKLEWVV